MKKFLLTLALFATLALGQPQSFTYSYSGLPIPIYPDDWNTVSAITLMVPKNMSVTKVTVSVAALFNGIGDLNIYMWSANGTRTKLLERNCGELQNINTTFDDSAPGKFSDACPGAGSAPYRGNEPLSNSVNENAFGFWKIAIENNGSSRTGTLTAFSITISGNVLSPPVIGPNTIVSTTSFEGGAVAPGDQLTLFGVNLGPTDGIRADASKNLPTSLGQTSVTFDGVAAPLYYVSDTYVQVQAPTTLTPGATTRIQVISTAGSSVFVNLPVVPANPGIYTYDAQGRGQARALNQDNTLNGDGSLTGADRAALVGSVLQVFATGLGALDPPVAQGTPAPASPLSTVTAPVTATIGGVPATVTYKGAAPGQVGMYQVNVEVPLLAPHGAARLVLSVNGNNSQGGVTVQIR